ncbi:unnamed protein product [Orchesella dallaii]|uniref:AMP-binding enzyme C-terminal domain-containing protein n=1 Tax=Orchesella dallaii TaxID=48710 RepID=A0ABP1PP48_9HEXA
MLISPTEIESIILDHPAIREVCVIGISDPKGGGKGAHAINLHRFHRNQKWLKNLFVVTF